MGKTINDRFANKELRPSGICLGATWAGIFATQRLQICGDWILSTQGSPMRGDWILSTQSSPIHWSLRDSRGDDIAFVSSQMQAKFRRRFRVVFS